MPKLLQLATVMKMPMRQFRDNIKGATKPFDYSFAPFTIAAGITVGAIGSETRVNVDADSQFYCYGIGGSYFVTNPVSGLLVNGNPLLHAEPIVQFIDESSGARLFDKPMLWGNAIGNARRPLWLNKPFPFSAGGVITAQYANPETVPYVIQVTLYGPKVYVR